LFSPKNCCHGEQSVAEGVAKRTIRLIGLSAGTTEQNH
jgi:hypothetical protein